MASLNHYTYTWGFAAGSANREDLLDIIVNISPTETPFFSTAPKTTTRHTTHDWLEDSLAAYSASPYGYTEGMDFSGQALSTRPRKTNWVEYFRKDFNVSETQRAVNPAGIKDEYQYQLGKSLKEMGRHIEATFFQKTGSATGTSGVQRKMKVLNDFITTNLVTAAAQGTATKASLDLLIENVYTAGGNPDRLYVHPNYKSQLAGVLGGTAVNYRNIAASDARVYANIDVYHSNFNVIQLVPDRFIPIQSATATAVASADATGFAWLIETPKARIAFLRPVHHKPLPPNGDSVRGMVIAELTLELMAEAAHGKIWNVVST